jgi:hypothetical protein
MAAELADLPGTQVRVSQGKEPHQFLALFSGKMVVRRGGVAGSGGFNKGDQSSSGQGGVHLFHIRGTSAVDTRAVKVAPRAESLNSGDCFVLLTPESAFEWSVGDTGQRRGEARGGAEGRSHGTRFDEGASQAQILSLHCWKCVAVVCC